MAFTGYMNVIAKLPRHPAHTLWIKDDLKELQHFVGGYIEVVTLKPDLVVICNEEGRLRGLTPNCSIDGISFVGPILVLGADGEEFTDCPLSIPEFEEQHVVKGNEKWTASGRR